MRNDVFSRTHIASKQCIAMLNQIGLKRLHQAVFLRLTADTKTVLSLLEPYVIYGTPNASIVRELIFKYGFIRYKEKKTPISSNTQIEELFGDSGVICVEDILHEVATVGPNFDKILKSLYPFMLPNPKDGWIGKKGLSFEKGGIAGHRGDKINDFIKTIL
jgi:large subunit ribosomal protein L7e